MDHAAELARLLFRKPDLLLLDEPTNHLDIEAHLWFEKYLSSFPEGVVITSHDRAFLNQVATRILAIEPGEAVHHRGNYDDYLIARERPWRSSWRPAARQEREIQRQMRSSTVFAPRRPRRPRSRAGSNSWKRYRSLNCRGDPERSASHSAASPQRAGRIDAGERRQIVRRQRRLPGG